MKKRYIKGKFGLSKFMTDNSDLISSGTNFASGAINSLDAGNEYGNKSTGVNVASSALSGAGLGMTFGPIGAGVGAVVGGLYGLYSSNKQRKQEEEMKIGKDRQEKSNALNSYANKARTNPDLINGSKDNQYYALGGGLGNRDKVLKYQQLLNSQGANLKLDGIWGKHTQSVHENSKLKSLSSKNTINYDRPQDTTGYSNINDWSNHFDNQRSSLDSYFDRVKPIKKYEIKAKERRAMMSPQEESNWINENIAGVGQEEMNEAIKRNKTKQWTTQNEADFRANKINRAGESVTPKQVQQSFDNAGIGVRTDYLDEILKSRVNERTIKDVPTNWKEEDHDAFIRNSMKKGNSIKKLGGEVDLHTSKSIGGKLHKLNSSDSYVEGQSHDNGGVKFPEEGVELEGGETMNDSFVFSKELGFADKHMKYIGDKSKLEKAALQRPNDAKLINGLKLIDNKVEKLKIEQEQTKQRLGIDNDLDVKAKGGLLDRDDLLGTNNVSEDVIPETKIRELNFAKQSDKPDKKEETETTPFLLSGSYDKKAKTGKEVEETKTHLRNNGLSDNAVRGILGNVSRESNFNPNAIGDNGNSYGLFQHNKSRKQSLLGFLKNQGLPSNSIKGQVEFTISELNKSGLIHQLNKARTPEEASDIFVSKFERPANLSNEINIRRGLTKQYNKMRNGGYLRGKYGLTPQEIRTKRMQEEYAKRTGGKDYKQLEEQRQKEALISGIKLGKETDERQERKRVADLNLSQERISRYKTPNSDISGRFKPESTGVSRSNYIGLGNTSKADSTKTESKKVNLKSPTSVSLKEPKSNDRTYLSDAYANGKELIRRNLPDNYDSLKNTGRKISNFFSDLIPDAPKNSSSGANPITGQQYNRVEKPSNGKSGFKFGDLFPDAPKGAVSGANPVTGQQYNQKPKDIQSTPQKDGESDRSYALRNYGKTFSSDGEARKFLNQDDGSSTKSIGLQKATQSNPVGQRNTPFAQNGKLSDLLMNKNRISNSSGSNDGESDRSIALKNYGRTFKTDQEARKFLNDDDGSSDRSIAFANSQKGKSGTSSNQSKRPARSLNGTSKNTNTNSTNSSSTDTGLSKNPILNNDFSNIGKQNQTGYANEQYYSKNDKNTTALTPDELANQRKGQIKMLSDGELADKYSKKGFGFDKEKINNALNQYGSDAIGLMRKYPNEPAPNLNSDVSLSRVNMNENRATNERDFSKVKRMAEATGSSNYGSVLGNLYGKKLEANNQISQTETNANTQISNQESLANNEIRTRNNSLTDDYNNRKYNRNIDIQNANQQYLGNMNEKSLMQTREKNQSTLDLAKMGLSYLSLDEGTRKKADSTLGSEMGKQATESLQSLYPKKKKIGKMGRMGGILK